MILKQLLKDHVLNHIDLIQIHNWLENLLKEEIINQKNINHQIKHLKIGLSRIMINNFLNGLELIIIQIKKR